MRRHPFVLHTTHAFVDCDVYRVPELAGLARDALVREIRTHCDDTGIPQPSAIISSGRGFYLKWYWSKPVGRDAVGGSMVGVNRALVRRLDRFGADPKATDATRLLRITGTEHTGAGRLVELLYVEQRDGRTITCDANEFTDVIAPSATAEPSVTAEASLAAEGSLDVPGPPRLNRDVHTCRVARPFTREGWHWAIVEDCYALARLRWGGTVPVGWRDSFGHVIACQLARIFHPTMLLREIVAAVRLILPAEYVARELSSHCSTLLRRARDAHASRDWAQFYRYGKDSLIDLLQITPAEERHMRALISDGEKHRRHLEWDRARRRATGMMERTAYLAEAAQRQTRAAMLRQGGLSWAEVAHSLGLSTAEAARQLARRARRMCDHEEPYGSAL